MRARVEKKDEHEFHVFLEPETNTEREVIGELVKHAELQKVFAAAGFEYMKPEVKFRVFRPTPGPYGDR